MAQDPRVTIPTPASAGSATLVDTYANLQLVVPVDGQIGVPTDAIYDYMVGDSGSWRYWYRGVEAYPPDLNSGPTTWVNQGGASTSTQTDGVMTLTPAGSGAANQHRLLVKTAPGTPYTVDMIIQSQGSVKASAYWRQSSDGKIIRVRIQDYNLASKHASPTGAPVNYYNDGGGDTCADWWQCRLADDGVNREIYASDGKGGWTLIHQVARNDYLVADQVGWGFNDEHSVTSPPVVLVSWKEG